MITAVYVVDTTSLSYNSSNFSRPEKYSVSRLFSLKNNKLIGKIAIFIHQKLRLIWKICFQNHHYNCSKAHCGWKKGWMLFRWFLFYFLCIVYKFIISISIRFLVTKTTGSGHTGWHTAKAAQRTGKINSITGGATISYSFEKKSSMPYSNSMIKQLLDNNI